MSKQHQVIYSPMIDPTLLVLASQEFLEFVKTKDCAVRNSKCYGDVVPAHTVNVGKGNNRKNPSLRHLSAAPLCTKHHGEQEGKTLEFGLKYNIDLSQYVLSLVIEFMTGVPACWFNDKGIVR